MTGGPKNQDNADYSAVRQRPASAFGVRQDKAIAGFVLVMIVVIWVSVITVTGNEETTAITAAISSNDNLARVLEEHSLRTLEAADQISRQLAHEYEEQGRALNLPVWHKGLNFHPMLHIFAAVIGAQGDALLHSGGDFKPVNLADRPYFKAHMESGSRMPLISQPVMARLDGRWRIAVTRRINNADGSFGGMAVIAIDPYHFTGLYEKLDLGERRGIGLAGMDGIMRARLDGGQRSLGEDMRNTELVRRMTSGETSASFTTQSAPDGVQRIVSFRMVRGYPPAVSVAVSEVAVLAGVRRTSGHFVLAAALLSLLVLAAGALLIFGARRQERYAVNLSSSEQRLRESQARLNDSQQRLLDQHSALTELTRNDLLIRGDLQSVFARITEVAAKVMGAERVSIWRFANDPAALRCSDMYDSATGLHDSGVELKFEDFPIHFAALQRGELIAAADASTHPLTCELAPYLTPLGIASIMDVPIFLAGKFSGVLCCQHVGAPAHWTEEQRLFGAALANLVEIAEGHAELRKAQAELFESEQRLRALINGIPDQVWLKDAQGRYVAFNRGVEDAYGWAGQSLAGKSARDLLPLEEGKRITAEDLSVVASNQVLRAERLTWRTRRWVEVIKIPVVGADGRVSGLVGILRDISERKQIEAERRGRDREQRRVFVREIHHRIKNHMQGVSALLSQHMRRDPALAGVISGAITQLQSLAVVHGLQAMGPAGLPQLLEAICAAPQCSGEDTVPVDLVVHFGAKATINEDDAIPVALILNELLLNARKQSDRLAEARRVRVLLDSVPDGVCISIRNEGGLKRAGHEPGKQGGGSGLLMVRSLLPASGAEFEIHATAREVCASLILRPPVIVVEPSQASREDDPCLPANVLL